MDRAIDLQARPYSSSYMSSPPVQHDHSPAMTNSPFTSHSTASYASSAFSPYSASQSHSYGATPAAAAPHNPHSHQRPNAKVKLVCVGDGGIGKTCLLMCYAENRFPEEYIPTVFETYVTKVPYGESKLVEFALWDTAGQEEYDRLRPLSYPESDIILICFACDYPPSLENIEEKWYPEVAHFCEGVPVILVATKTDLRSDRRSIDLLKAQGRMPISTIEGQAAARRMGAKYAEVSAIRGDGVREVFEMALREAMKTRTTFRKLKRPNKCTIL